MINVIARITLKDNKVDEYVAVVHDFVDAIRAEPGCIEYGPTADVESEIGTQVRDSNVITTVERWESMDHFAGHLSGENMDAYRPLVADLVASVQLFITESV